jgi:1,4-dihydroxy-2-naphthoate octaprenyltransferase
MRPPLAGAVEWLRAARPRTLPAAVAPVAVGVAVARSTGHVVAWHAALALVVSLAMQVGANLANDYSDGVRGTDAERVGPIRLVASGLASPGAVRLAAVATFAVGAVAGLVLAIAVSPWLVAVGAAAIAAAWLYTGGPRPYGYAGYGEVSVFVFFGLVAVVGTTYVTSGELPAIAYLASVPVGLLAVALLVANNLRDIGTDARSGKRTLVVRLGDHRARLLYVAVVVVALVSSAGVAPWRTFALLGLVAAPIAARPVRQVLSGAAGPDLVPVLEMTGTAQLVFGLAFAIGVAL